VHLLSAAVAGDFQVKVQEEREAALAKIKPDLITRAILPADYKRREH
jgi:hypothetical protein